MKLPTVAKQDDYIYRNRKSIFKIAINNLFAYYIHIIFVKYLKKHNNTLTFLYFTGVNCHLVKHCIFVMRGTLIKP